MARLQSSLAQVAYLRGDRRSAIELLRQSAAYHAKLSPDGTLAADVDHDLGVALAAEGHAGEAERLLRRSLSLREKIAPASRDTAESRHDLGMLLWKARRPGDAEPLLRGSIEDLEAQQAKLGGSEESRSIFTAAFADYYADYLRLLVELGSVENAFHLLERFRAAAFLRMLAQRDLAAPRDTPPDLEKRRRATNAEYDRVQEEIEALRPRTQAEQLEIALARLKDLRRTQRETADAIRKASPRYGALRYPRPLDAAGARAVLDPGTLLLSYAVGADETFLFALSSDPGPDGALRVYRLPIGRTALRGAVDRFRRLIRWNQSGPELLASSRELYATLLEPVQSRISRSERVLILPDGPLHRLPWAALARDDSGRSRFLAESRAVHVALSMTVYSELQKARVEPPRDPRLAVAAFGDPRYPERGAGVFRGARGAAAEPEPLDEPRPRGAVRGGFEFEPLPQTRQEVAEIAALYSPKSVSYVGAEATEERATSVGKGVSLIHYACHGVIDERFPLDSALAFTIPDKPLAGRENGLLQAWEIFDRMRIDADLVTLSACDSGLGQEAGGEGLIGLTRAFQYAGARSVLASLWSVQDRSTAVVMKQFYRYLKAGTSKADALRLAQIDLIHSAEFAQPRDWAAFQLNGDWK